MAPFQAIRYKSLSVDWFFVGSDPASAGRRSNPQKIQPPSCGLFTAIPGANCAINQHFLKYFPKKNCILKFIFYICRVNSKNVEMNLSNAEEQLMEHLWKLEKAFMKELLEVYAEPKPATTTIATLLKRMIDKKFVAYQEFGNSRQYYPLVKKSDYFSKHVNGLIKNFFNDSASQFASFFTKETNLSEKELEELKKIIDVELQKKKK